MAIRNKETGHSAEYDLLYEILKKLDQLVKVIGSSITVTSTTTLP